MLYEVITVELGDEPYVFFMLVILEVAFPERPVLLVASECLHRITSYNVCYTKLLRVELTGQDFLGEDAPPIGTFFAPNLTPVHLADWSDGEIVRAIRETVDCRITSYNVCYTKLLR